MGQVFAGRYELVDPLGGGGGGDVWRAWDHRERRYVAAKVLRQVDAASLLRFVREQSFRIEHPHVLTPLGWAGDDDLVLFTMPIVPGGSAATLGGDHGPLPPAWVARLLDQTLAALVEIHRRGLVHRDVKPANLLLDVTGTGEPRVRLSDFGIAARTGDPRLTATAMVIGTPGYLAPEVMEGAHPAVAADLYAAGMTAVSMATGRRAADLERATLDRTLATSQVPAELAAVLLRLTSRAPGERPVSAQAARDELEATGWPGAPLPADVEVFDQLPPLPQGWSAAGPVPRTLTGVARPPAPTAAPTSARPVAAAPPSAPAPAVPPGPALAAPTATERAPSPTISAAEATRPRGVTPAVAPERGRRPFPLGAALALTGGAGLLVTALALLLR